MLQKYLTFWTHAFDSNSETDASTYNIIFLINTCGNVLIYMIMLKTLGAASSGPLGFFTSHGAIGLLALVINVLGLVPSVTLVIRRLNSMQKPAWQCLLMFVPFISWYMLYKLSTTKGEDTTSVSTKLSKIKGYQEVSLDNFADTALKPIQNTSQTPEASTKSMRKRTDKTSILAKLSVAIKPVLIKLGLVRVSASGDLDLIKQDVNSQNDINVDKGAGNFKKVIVTDGKPKFYMRVITKKELVWLDELRYTLVERELLAKNRARFLAISCVGVIAGVLGFGNPSVLISCSIIFAGVIIYDRHSRLKREYQRYLFDKQVQYSKFTRTVVPYLMNQQGYSFYEVLKKIAHRMRIEAAYETNDSAAKFKADPSGLDATFDEGADNYDEFAEVVGPDTQVMFDLETMPEQADDPTTIAESPINMFDFEVLAKALDEEPDTKDAETQNQDKGTYERDVI